MRIRYEIKTTPDDENPNEQSIGSVIQDDRIYGLENVTLTTQDSCYNESQFTKNKLSNKLTSSTLSFFNGQIIILDAY